MRRWLREIAPPRQLRRYASFLIAANMSNYATLKEHVEYGLASIDQNRTIEVSLSDLVRTYQTIGLLINFFHQPLHYPDLDSVKQFVDIEADNGAFELLKDLYYKRLYEIWPPDIQTAFAEGRFDNPEPPNFYEPRATDGDA